MAILNGLYIHVTSEEMSNEVDVTTHPVEKGIDITDTVRRKAIAMSLSGKIVDYGDMKAYQVLEKIHKLQKDGSLINYTGRNIATNMQIKSFDTSHPNTNHGGADFTMELKEVRIAKSSYSPKKQAAQEQKQEEKKNPDPVSLTVGSTVVFNGGSVYVSSDATKPAATRSRSTCKITHVSNASWSTHKYHLESTDGKMVYGWVDLGNIEGAETSSTSGTTNAGTQQVQSRT